jgi:hypothetical protein
MKKVVQSKLLKTLFFKTVFRISSLEQLQKLDGEILKHNRVVIENIPNQLIQRHIKAPDFRNVSTLAVVNCHKNFSPNVLVRLPNIFNVSVLYLNSDPCEDYVLHYFNQHTRKEFQGYLDFQFNRRFHAVEKYKNNKWKLVKLD